ncbi:MAG TPA: PEGA domain-containing protein [Flavobacteriales bacterium]|nr:PEGA domain-containing protein [Flavobacteriales bacterium]HIB76564.1 PEGA domain-containing protein [Flavobacteriales bacterium]HIN41703.1 PEGA domain-containing protein [Flavobacteriales bacterium]HIO16344.1 PEGA domain-containing protein [Flavobacteriales bacterium]HIO59256.1 PEGA domain-containing protein [Flavobacteriales bacterium]
MRASKSILTSFSLLSLVFLLAGCSSSTMIQSIPSGAKVYLDSEYAGTTPYLMEDMKISWTSTRVELKEEGYENFVVRITKDEEVNVGAIIGGLFFLVPFAWVMDYKPTHTYELKELSNQE